MTEIRWLALLPDPVTGLDQPVKAIDGRPMIWVAVDRAKATKQVKAALSPAAFRLVSVVSVVDWQTRQQTPQRAKLVTDFILDAQVRHARGWKRNQGRNPRRICVKCFGPTGAGSDALYCSRCRTHGPRRKTAKLPVPLPPRPAA